MGTRSLAEAIILQSLEDMWYPAYRKDSKKFFEGDGFKICSDIAGLIPSNKVKFLYYTGGKRHGKISRISRDQGR